jgi:hypothetical protein
VTYAYDTKSKYELGKALSKDTQIDLRYMNSYGIEDTMDIIDLLINYKSDHDDVWLDVKLFFADNLKGEEFEMKDLVYIDSDLAYNHKTKDFYNYYLNKSMKRTWK